MSREEIKTLILSSNMWYLNEWNRTLTSKPIIGVYVEWLRGENSPAKNTKKYQYPEYKNSLGHNSIDRWDKIETQLV